MFIDSHCHLNCLDLEALGTDLAGVLAAAREAGVDEMLCVAIDQQTQQQVLAIASDYPQVYASVGVHPNVNAAGAISVNELLALAEHPRVIAIGETGLDYFRTEAAGIAAQQEQFRTHIRAANACAKPLIVHSRDANDDTLRILTEEGAEQAGGVMHCFVGDIAMAEAALAQGFYISFSGILTFKNAAALRQVALEIPLERLLIETDSPYLAPVPYRGKCNQPAYVNAVAAKLAELRGLSLTEIAALTTANFHRLFNCP